MTMWDFSEKSFHDSAFPRSSISQNTLSENLSIMTKKSQFFLTFKTATTYFQSLHRQLFNESSVSHLWWQCFSWSSVPLRTNETEKAFTSPGFGRCYLCSLIIIVFLKVSCSKPMTGVEVERVCHILRGFPLENFEFFHCKLFQQFNWSVSNLSFFY